MSILLILILIVSHSLALDSWKKIFAKALVRPFALFAREPIIQLLGVYMAFLYGLLYRKLHSVSYFRTATETMIFSLPNHHP